MIEIAQNWLNKLRTEYCVGPWISPAFPVRKKIYDWRGVVYARYMNAQCMDDAYPLPRLMDILVSMDRNKFFSVMDRKDAFHQITLDEESRPNTGMSTPIGLQQWCVVVMGWKNGVPYCQRTQETVLANVSEIAAGYVDEIIAGSDEVLGETTPDLLRKHDREIHMVLEALKLGKMLADIKKCKLFVKEVTFC